MDVFIFLAVIAGIAVLAPTFGRDTRDVTDSYPRREHLLRR